MLRFFRNWRVAHLTWQYIVFPLVTVPSDDFPDSRMLRDNRVCRAIDWLFIG
jgi:hypothetical protein